MTASTLFAEGKLREALAVQQQHVQQQPADAAARLFLMELLLFLHQLDAVRTQLDHLPDEPEGMREYRLAYANLIDAEAKRLAIFERGRPTFLSEPPEHLLHRVEALEAYRLPDRDEDATIDLLDQASEAQPELFGHVDGREFDGLRNSDDLLASVLEVLVDGEYAWVPFDQMRKLRLAEIDCPRDELFRPAQITLRDGTTVEVHVPTRYAATRGTNDEHFLRGWDTDARNENEPLFIGIGTQLLFFGESELTLLDFRMVEFG